MSFSDSDWTSEAADAAQRDNKGPPRVLVFAAGVLLGATVAASALWAIGRTPAPAGAAIVARHDAPRSEARPEPTAPPMPAGPAPTVEPARPALQIPAPTAAASAALTLEQRRRMERAWQAFYPRPTACDHNPTPQQMIDCANHHIRTRREFEERYAAGRL
jgi:hypothetical protein